MPATPKGQIPIDNATLRAGYPTYNKLPKPISDYMDALNTGLEAGKPKNTPRCFQVSEAFNKVGAEHKITSHSYRRARAKLGSDYDLGAVDELQYFLFWPLAGEDGVDAAPAWLQGWWDVNDGNQYYYYFSDQFVVTYTKVEPSTTFGQPARNAMNEGKVTLTDNPNKLVLTWNAADDGTTEEIFTFDGTAPTEMRGKSNRYANLTATRKATWSKKK
jgi:hypothetical protein